MMENPVVSGLRSRSRSKTPFLRTSCDREHCLVDGDHVHGKSGRKTPVKRSTPIKQLSEASRKSAHEPIDEEDEDHISPPAVRTRYSTRTTLIKTSDYSSEESPDRLKGKRNAQNQQNHNSNENSKVSTSSKAENNFNVTYSPIYANSKNLSWEDRSSRSRFDSNSACSSDSSFAEQALADASTLVETDPKHNVEHLPYRLFKMAGEYWNKYPKTDYTYSYLSRDRVELAPGQVAVPNMSRRSLSQFRLNGPSTSQDEVDQAQMAWMSSPVHKYSAVDSSDEDYYVDRKRRSHYTAEQQYWWITRILISILTTITSATTTVYDKLVGRNQRGYSSRYQQPGLLSRAASATVSPFIWIYTFFKKIVTTTVTTVTETISPSTNHVTRVTRSSRLYAEQHKERKLWPLLLLLLIPLLGYGCYTCSDEIKEAVQNYDIGQYQEYEPPVITNDPDLTKRISALEAWARSVDTKLKSVDQKLNKLDNIEAEIESYTLKHLQNNIINIIKINQNREALAAELKSYFYNSFMAKDDMDVFSQNIHDRIMKSMKPGLTEEDIRLLVQEYLSTFEKKQYEIIVTKIRQYTRELEIRNVHSGSDIDLGEVKKIVTEMLKVYDADKTGMADFALESAGGQVLSTRCTELYQIKTKQYMIMGLPVWTEHTSPRYALIPGVMPAECWAFQGFPGYLVIKLYAIIEVTGFSVEHMSKLLAIDEKIESAPKNFSVYGLQDELDQDPHLFGNYVYDENSTSLQYFPVMFPKTENIDGIDYPIAFDIVELRVESNYGNPTYTCVYRFRVHGNPLSDIKRATEDNMKDNQT